MKYEKMKDGVGITMPANRIFRFACCDCGLVHDMVIAAAGRREVGLAVRRNKRATAARRRRLNTVARPAR
jgi:hypothetical protein